jgi:hypothetical protein
VENKLRKKRILNRQERPSKRGVSPRLRKNSNQPWLCWTRSFKITQVRTISKPKNMIRLSSKAANFGKFPPSQNPKPKRRALPRLNPTSTPIAARWKTVTLNKYSQLD